MFVYFIIALLIAAGIIAGLRAALGYITVANDADREYRYRSENGLLPPDLGARENFMTEYRRAFAPREAVFQTIGLLAAAALTLPMLGVWTFVFEHGWRLAGQPREFEPGYLVWQFMLLAAMIGSYALLAWGMARLYYRRIDRHIRARQKLA